MMKRTTRIKKEIEKIDKADAILTGDWYVGNKTSSKRDCDYQYVF